VTLDALDAGAMPDLVAELWSTTLLADAAPG